MKLLIVSAQEGLADYFQKEAPGTLRTIVQYQHPLKALDNLAEIAPDIVLWSYDDFPRHWKAFYAALTKEERNIRLYLVSESTLPAEELKKRTILRIEGSQKGFFSEELSHFLKQHDQFIHQAAQPIPLEQASLFFVDLASGAYLAKEVTVSKTEIHACLIPANYAILPMGGQVVNAILRHGKAQIPLELQVKIIDSTGSISFTNCKLHEKYLNFCDSLLQHR
jgi:hypothetical protein